MDCMPHTSFVGKQNLGVTFVYTKYFLKNRDQLKRRRSFDFPSNANKLADAHRRKTLSPNVNASFGNARDEVLKEPPIVLLYNHLQLLFSKAKQYAVVHKCLCNALRTRPGDINGKRVKENRRKLSDILEQISMLSRKIESLRHEKRNICQLILQRNIRLYAIIFIEELSLRMSEETERITFAIEESSCIEDEASCHNRLSALCLSRNNNCESNELQGGCLPRLPVEDCGLVNIVRSMLSFSTPKK